MSACDCLVWHVRRYSTHSIHTPLIISDINLRGWSFLPTLKVLSHWYSKGYVAPQLTKCARPAAQKGCASYAQGLAPPFCAGPTTACCRGVVLLHVNFLCFVQYSSSLSCRAKSRHPLTDLSTLYARSRCQKKLIFSENLPTKIAITVCCNGDFAHYPFPNFLHG